MDRCPNPACDNGWTYDAAGDVIPCSECRRPAFQKWAGGHYRHDHEPHLCATCRSPHPERRAKKTEPKDPVPVPDLPERKDLA